MTFQTIPVVKSPKLWQARKITVLGAMDPIKFCRIYVLKDPEENGYFSACCREISRVTGAPYNTVKNWGDRFQKMPTVAKQALFHFHQSRKAVIAFDELAGLCQELLEAEQVQRLSEGQAMAERHSRDRARSDELAIRLRALKKSLDEPTPPPQE